ncbi:MAG: C4-dicarboxylate ABC transporter, partial [Burkholderiaceae bacterium]
VLFLTSALLFSQGAAVRSIVPLGIGLGIPAANLVAMFPACTGYFVIPTGGLTVACVAFDRTGTTRIGRGLLNHSFMLPGLVSVIGALAVAAVLLPGIG